MTLANKLERLPISSASICPLTAFPNAGPFYGATGKPSHVYHEASKNPPGFQLLSSAREATFLTSCKQQSGPYIACHDAPTNNSPHGDVAVSRRSHDRSSETTRRRRRSSLRENPRLP